MRALIQRVSSASVRVGNDLSEIGPGLMILLGVRRGDTPADAAWLAVKCAGLRIFEDTNEKMNLSVQETGGEALVVSQFTLYGDADRGRRPSFTEAAPPEDAEPLYRHFVAALQAAGVKRVATGVFQAMMTVTIVNEGPVTIVVDSRKASGEGATAKPEPIAAFTQVFYSLEKPLVLASASPRRADLLKSAGIPVELFSSSDVDESFPPDSPPSEVALDLARKKALAAASTWPGRHVLGADTVVDVDGRVLGKPGDDREAVEMLKALSGRVHEVHTGIAVVSPGGALNLAVETTQVFFRQLSDDEINAYVATGEPHDKAGAYGIQGLGGLLVERIEGSYDNVMGLPITRLITLLREMA